MNSTILNKAKHALMEQKQEVLEHLQGNHTLSSDELSHYDNHPGEQATELFVQEKEMALDQHAKERMEQIHDSLQAIEEGTYGVCEVCGEAIQEDRLLTVPTTFRCVEHADNEMRQDRPVEEEILEPDVFEQERKGAVKESTAYDGKDTWRDVEAHGSSETPSDFYEDQDDYGSMYIDADRRLGRVEAIDEVATTDRSGKSPLNRRKPK